MIKPVFIREFPEFAEITGTLHSGTAYEVNNHMFLFDEKNMYVVKVNPPSITVYPDLYCIGINCFNKSYNYALCQSLPQCKNPGFRLFDLESIIKRGKSGMVLVKDFNIGT